MPQPSAPTAEPQPPSLDGDRELEQLIVRLRSAWPKLGDTTRAKLGGLVLGVLAASED